MVVEAPEETIIQRLQERNGISREEALARIRSQISNEERARFADEVIVNDAALMS